MKDINREKLGTRTYFKTCITICKSGWRRREGSRSRAGSIRARAGDPQAAGPARNETIWGFETGSRNSKSEISRGFTLVELVLVIVILGILAIVAVPAFNNLTPVSLDAAARKVKEDLRYAQSLATTTGESHGFEVTGNTTYKIYNVGTGATVVSPYHNTPMAEDLSDEFGNAQFNSTTYKIEFNSAGQPITGGGTTVQIDDGSNFKQIQITQISGYIRLL